MKKVLGLILAGALTLSMLAACGAASSSEPAPAADPAPAASSSAPAAPASSSAPADAPAADGFDATGSITLVSREDGSGTRGAFVELTGVLSDDDEDMTSVDAVVVNSTSVVMTTVAGDPYGIGYISLGSLDDSVKALSVEGVVPSVEAVKDASYKISRPFMLAYNGELSADAQDFVDFILSAEGQAVVVENGYISIDEAAPAYAGSGSGKVVVAGSSSVTPVMEKLKEAYELLNADADIEIQMSDSSTGMTAAIDGNCDIGMASRELKDSELETLTPITMAMDGIAVIVNNENPATDVTLEALKGIYTGETTTWDAV